MSDRKIAQIKRLYHGTTAATVERDLAQAVEILKSLPDEDTRSRAAVFMDGLSQMRSEWRLEAKTRQRKRGRASRSRSAPSKRR